ncbi:hypothetical protein [Kitasatospora sp. NPDC058046]|uniref:hypothetical protein n=1 Tax=Kitasatospora sp. NPDC058046 TaxID=3346312 RepID=UPI0036D7A5B3
MTDTWSPVGAVLLASARHARNWPEQGACWLLAEHGIGESYWPGQLDRAGLLAWHHARLGGAPHAQAFVRWPALARTLTRQIADGPLHGSPAQWAVLRVALALTTGRGGDWATDLSRLEEINRTIVLGAVAWAAGGEQAAYPYTRTIPDAVPAGGTWDSEYGSVAHRPARGATGGARPGPSRDDPVRPR